MVKIRLILFNILILISFHVKSQSYIPLIGDSNRWIVKIEANIGDEFTPQYIKYSIVFSTADDSLYKGNYYKKIYCNDPDVNVSQGINGYIGLVREDTVKKQVFFIKNNQDDEFILYDFSLLDGDSFYFDLPIPFEENDLSAAYPGKYKLSKEYDSIEKRFNFFFYGNIIPKKFRNELVWVEGVGCLKSPFYYLYPYNTAEYPDYDVQVQCVYKDGVRIYSRDVCTIFTHHSAIQEASLKQRLVFRYVNDQLDFSIPANLKNNRARLFIFSLDGRKVIDKALVLDQDYTSVKLNRNLMNGIYIVQVYAKGQIFSKKVLISE